MSSRTITRSTNSLSGLAKFRWSSHVSIPLKFALIAGKARSIRECAGPGWTTESTFAGSRASHWAMACVGLARTAPGVRFAKTSAAGGLRCASIRRIATSACSVTIGNDAWPVSIEALARMSTSDRPSDSRSSDSPRRTYDRRSSAGTETCASRPICEPRSSATSTAPATPFSSTSA